MSMLVAVFALDNVVHVVSGPPPDATSNGQKGAHRKQIHTHTNRHTNSSGGYLFIDHK